MTDAPPKPQAATSRPASRLAPRGSSGTRTPLFGWVTALALLGLAVAFIAAGSWRLARVLDSAALRAQGVQATADLDRELTRLRFFPRVLADDPRLERALTRGLPADILAANQSLARISEQSGAAFSFLMDTEGWTVASSNYDQSTSFIGRNYGFRPYFRQALDLREGTFYAVGATTGLPGYFLARAMTDAAGEDLGVVVVKLDLEGFIDRYRASDRRLLVADDLGVIILSTEPSLLYTPLSPLSQDALTRADKQRRYTLNTAAPIVRKGSWLHAGGAEFLTTQTNSGVEQWTLLALRGRGAVFNRALGLFAIGGAILAIAVLGLLLVRLQLRYSSQLRRQVTEKSRQLQAAQRQLIAEENLSFIGRMSAAISHEINQPLASLRFNLATLGKLQRDDEEVQSIVGQSKNTASRIARVIETLRLFARRKEAQTSTLDLRAVARAAEAVMAQERPRASEAITVVLPQEPLYVAASDVLMQQVAINLLTNALDATKALEKPQIELRLMREVDATGNPSSRAVLLIVTDNGAGVDKALQGDLFTPFASGKPLYKGLGLGLSLAQSIVADAGGSLEYAPLSAPFQSRFVVRLPAHD